MSLKTPNKMIEIIEQKNAPPFGTPTQICNKMNEIISQKNNGFVHAWTHSET